MVFNYKNLNDKIEENGFSKKELAYILGISIYSLTCKIDSKIEFTQREIVEIVEILHIPKNNISKYFFNVKVQ